MCSSDLVSKYASAKVWTKDSDPAFLHTFALAYFDTGDRARAVTTQQRALDRLSAQAPERADYEAELAKYRAGK